MNLNVLEARIRNLNLFSRVLVFTFHSIPTRKLKCGLRVYTTSTLHYRYNEYGSVLYNMDRKIGR